MEITIAELTALLSSKNDYPQPQMTDRFVGAYVICRCDKAGVHAGRLVSQDGDVVVLENSRRLWSWKANAGIALSGVAQHGLASGCKIDTENPIIRLTGVVETIPCSTKAEETIKNA